MSGYSPSRIIQTKSKGMGKNTLSEIMRIGENGTEYEGGEKHKMRNISGYPMLIATHSNKLRLEVQPPISVFEPSVKNLMNSMKRA